MNEILFGINPVFPDIAKTRKPEQETCVKELFNLHQDWEVVGWEVKNLNLSTEYVLISGAAYPEKITRGKRKGQTNFKKPLPATECEIPLTEATFKEWLSKWESETGFCSYCKGSGWQCRGWEREKGAKHRRCPHCNATGRANERGLRKVG